jgi:hypothetical protein
MSKRYVIHPGEVVSSSDGDIHFISAEQLVHLYGVNRLECIIDTEKGGQWARGYTKDVLDGLVHLYPRKDGNYEIPKD